MTLIQYMTYIKLKKLINRFMVRISEHKINLIRKLISLRKNLLKRYYYPAGIINGKIIENPSERKIMLCGHSVQRYLAGAEISLIDIARAMNDSKFNLIIVLPEFEKSYVSELAKHAVRLYIVPYMWWGKADDDRNLIWELIRIIDNEHVDLVYANTIMIREPLSAARFTGIPGVTHIRELLFDDTALTKWIGKSKPEIILEVNKRADFLIANSQKTAEFFKLGRLPFIIHNQVNTELFDIENKIINNEVKIALISSNIPKKGIYDFISIAEICEQSTPNAKFLLIGPENEFVKKLFSDENSIPVPRNIEFVGYFKRPVDAIQKANIVVNLSRFSESFGRTILEAMAARRPVLVYDYGALPELVSDGINGYIVPYLDLQSAARHLDFLCKNPARIAEMGENGRLVAVRNYSSGLFEKKLLTVLNQVFEDWGKNDLKRESKNDLNEESESNSRVFDKETYVSVIIPNYNYSKYLHERINSVIKQTYPPCEIIFLDDASSDESVEIARSLLEKSPIPCKIIVNPKNEGTYNQWMRGIREAKGKYIWIAEADDSSETNFLERMIQRIFIDQSVLCYCQSKRIDENGKIIAARNLHHTDALSTERWKYDYTETGLREVVDYLLYRNTVPNISACLIDRAYLNDLPSDFQKYKSVGDYFFHCFLLKKGKISFVSAPLNNFRRHNIALTRQKGSTSDYLYELISVKRYIAENFPIKAFQIERMIKFLDKDFVFNGINKNSEFDFVKSELESIRHICKSRKRFVFLTTNNSSHDGGSEKLWQQTVTRLRQLNHDVMVIIRQWKPSPPFFGVFTGMGIKIVFKENFNPKIAIDFNPDLMVISTGDQDEGMDWFEFCNSRNIFYVIINHLTKAPQYWPIRKANTPRLIDGFIKARKVLFTSHNNHQLMELRLSCKIPNADIFINPMDVPREINIPFPSLEQGLYLAIVGRLLTIHKGQQLAIELMNQDKWRQRNIVLNLYGKGPDEDSLKQLIEGYQLSNVYMRGHVEDIVSVWMENHVLLLSSFMEGMPLVTVAAMMCGRVPVVTDVGGHREIIDDNISGFIAQNPTINDLDEALERAWNNQYRLKEIGQEARRRILNYIPENPIDHFIDQIIPFCK